MHEWRLRVRLCACVCACINPRCFIMIPKEVKDKFFTEAQIFHLQKVAEQTYVYRCFFYVHKESVPDWMKMNS
jgi:hypothetical protein